jgi:hypothetical protein
MGRRGSKLLGGRLPRSEQEEAPVERGVGGFVERVAYIWIVRKERDFM